MLKWLYEIVLALIYKRVMRISFRRALRFVRCDFLTQQKIREDLGLEDIPGKENSDEKQDH